jgi:hypothetical protein
MEIDRREFLIGLATTAAAPILPALPKPTTASAFERLGLVDGEQLRRAVVLARRLLIARITEQRAREAEAIMSRRAAFNRDSLCQAAGVGRRLPSAAYGVVSFSASADWDIT